MKNFKPIIIALVALAVFGCTSESEPDQVSQAASDRAPDEKKTQATMRTEDPVSGKIRDVQFSVEQAILKSGTLELRQGSDFFADLSAEIVLFDDNPAGNGFKVPSGGPGLVPHLRLKQKLEDQGVPDTQSLMGNYQLDLVFGDSQPLGVPFSIVLTAEQHGTELRGSGFATYGDIKVIQGKLDTTYQSLDTLKLLAKRYTRRNYERLTVLNDFGTTLYTNGSANPATAFVGLEALDGNDERRLVKLQFIMGQNGWEVANELEIDQIHEAHPVLSELKGNLRTVEGAKVQSVAGDRFEKELQARALVGRIRGTSVNCYLSEAANKASCRAAGSLVNEGGYDCFRSFYLMTNDGPGWRYETDLEETQKVDYKTGQVVEGRAPSQYSCSA
ncbi:hypothetical protein NUW46_20220 (plasmid) [Marinobacter sp. MA]|uniref:hypothetical protein n=1 Tax=Marinobacter sp. MA TaxID=2971606 RepID=UPI0019B0A88D|nr:hypothetical protein [Marinobacter sp.]